MEVAVQCGKVDIAAYLCDVQFAAAVKHGSADNAKNLLALGAGRPVGLLHHVAKSSHDGDMATWLLSIGYRMDEEDKVGPPIFHRANDNSIWFLQLPPGLLLACIRTASLLFIMRWPTIIKRLLTCS